MVEKITVNPEAIKAYGNIIGKHDLTDYETSQSVLSRTSETVNNVLAQVYNLSYSQYGFMFGLDLGNEQLYLQVEEEDSLSLGWDSSNKQLYVVNDTDEAVDFGFSNKQLYIEVGE